MDNFDKIANNEDYQKLMNKVMRPWHGNFTPEEMEQLKLICLWKCTQNFDATKEVKFTSYLYASLRNAIIREIKNKNSKYSYSDIGDSNNLSCGSGVGSIDTKNAIGNLPDEYQNIIFQRFFSNMTVAEIGRANGYSRETARRKIKKAVKLCENIIK